MKITREQIKNAFVSDTMNIGDYVYNNQDWYQEDAQRMRYILVTRNMSPGDSYADFEGEEKQLKLGQEDNRFFDCIEFGDYNGTYKIKDEKRLLELINMSDEDVADYIAVNEYDWIGDDYDHAMEYLFTIMNEWQEKEEQKNTGHRLAGITGPTSGVPATIWLLVAFPGNPGRTRGGASWVGIRERKVPRGLRDTDWSR